MKFKSFHICCLFLLFFISCSKNSSNNSTGTNTATPSASTVTVNLTGTKQTIDGFGGSTAWSGALTDAQADALFGNSNTAQIGLSICRLRIDPGQNWSSEKSNAQKANARGAKVFATPWTPPASLKTNNNVVGGTLDPSKYADYASYLKSFGDYIKNAGVTLTAISLQNEPDFKVTYESCSWTATQMLNFAKNNAAAIGYPFMMPESFNFNINKSDSALNDAAACANITYIGGHIYGSSPFTYTNAINHGKKIWMTEHYYDDSTSNINIALKVAKEINDCMCNNMNAYCWWWMLPLNGSKCNLIDSKNALTKNACAIGQFSKWIRPDYKRIDATANPNSNVYISAYTNGTKVVIVAINMNTVAISQPFKIQNGNISSVTPYVTSGSKNITVSSNLTVSNNSVTAILDAHSITTLVSN